MLKIQATVYTQSEMYARVEDKADDQIALYEALNESEIKRWSKTSIQLYTAVFIGFLCSCANGYDGSLFSGILSMPYFQSTFQSGIDGKKVSLIASLYTV